MRAPLTRKGAQTLVAIVAHIEEHGYPPTVRELGDELSLSLSGMYDRLNQLRDRGWLDSKEWGQTRALRLTDSEVHVHLPLDMQDMIRRAL